MTGSLGALVTVLAALEGLRHAGVAEPSPTLPEQRTHQQRPVAPAVRVAPYASVLGGTSVEEADDPPAAAKPTPQRP